MYCQPDAGHPPAFQQLQEEFVDVDWIRSGLRDLAQRKLLVLGENYRILMAHPFSSVPMIIRVFFCIALSLTR